MKRKIKIIISCIITISLTVGLLRYLTDLMERKASDFKYADFFEQDEDFDVLFFGTSHVINGIFPMELWNDYGIVSYNFGGHCNQIATSYWVMENALEYTTPKVAVIDCLYVNGRYKSHPNFSFSHLSLDTFPLNQTKIQAIWDILDDSILASDISSGKTKEIDEPRTKIALLWDYSVYHSRWAELTENDFEPSSSYEKGAESQIKVTRNELTRIDADRKIDDGTTGEKYLRKIIEDCQNREINVLLTYLPFPATESQQMEANYVRDLADEYDVNYINFLDLDLINYQTDLYDEDSHLNPSGARKVTDYLGKYLLENYDITDQRNNEAYSEWYTDYEEYNELKNSNLAKQTDIVTYLMLLSNDNIDAVIDVRNKDIFENTWIIDLLKNLGVDVNLLNEDTDFIIIKNGGEDAIVLDNFKGNGISTDSEIGNISLDYQGASGEYSLYVDGIEYLNASSEDNTSMQISVLRDKSVIDNVKFIYTINPDTKDIEISDVYK